MEKRVIVELPHKTTPDVLGNFRSFHYGNPSTINQGEEAHSLQHQEQLWLSWLHDTKEMETEPCKVGLFVLD